MSNALHEQAPAIKSVDILIRWLIAIFGALLVVWVFAYKLRLDVDAHHDALTEHGVTLRQLERSDAVKTERLESMLKLLEKIDRKLNP